MNAAKRERLLQRYRQRIVTSRRWRDQEGFDDLWRRLIDLYAGRHFPEGLGSEDRIAVNIAFSTVNVVEPSVAVNHPSITVLARQPEDEPGAAILEAVTNYWWRHFDVQPEHRAAVKDSLIIGHGWLKCGYRYVEEEAPNDEYDSELEELTAQAVDFAVDSPDLAGDVPSPEEIAASIPATKMVAVEDRPFVERVSPFDMFVNPEATSMSDVRWIAQRIRKPLEQVRKDPRFKRAARRSVQPDEQTAADLRADRKPDGAEQWVTYWELYDLADGHLCVFADSGDDFLVEPMRQPYTFGHPYVMVAGYRVPDRFYPMGELEAIEPLQQELNKTRSQMMNHRKRYTPKYLYKQDAFDTEAVGQLVSDVPNTMVPVVGSYELGQVIAPVPQEMLPPDFYNQSEIIQGDMNVISGVSEYARGQLPEIRRTATEASIIQDAANARAADKLAQVEMVIAQVARRLVQLAQQYLEGEHVVRLVGVNGLPHWVAFTRDMIEGEYDFEVEGGSTQPRNETFRRQSAMQMLSALGPLMSPELGLINTRELLRHVLQHGFGLKDPDKFLGDGGGGPMAMVGDQSMPDPLEMLALSAQSGMPQQGLPPEMAGMLSAVPPDQQGAGGIPTEAQLAGQVGLRLGEVGGR